MAVVIKMSYACIVAAAEPVAIVRTGTGRNMRVTIFIAVIHVRMAMIIVVLAGSFNTVMIALALNIAEFLRRCIPATVVLTVAGRRPLGRSILCHG
jgi:hypothetical protein